MKKIYFLLILIFAIFGTVLLLQYSGAGTSLLWSVSDKGSFLLPLVIVSALIDSINPCAFSILILTIAFLFSLGKFRSHILTIGGFYIAGLFLVYLLIGLGLLEMLHLFNTPHFMAKLGASLMLVFGIINLIGAVFPSFPIKLKIPDSAHHRMALLMEKASLPAAFVLGILVGLCEFPCTGGPYLSILGLLHDTATYAKGLMYLVLYNLVFISPLILILLLGSSSELFQKVEQWKKENLKMLKLITSLAMILLAFFIFSL